MYTLLLAIILSLGFLFCHINKKAFYKLHRTQNQYLYLKCALFGSILFIGAGAFLLTICLIYPNICIFLKENEFLSLIIISILSYLFLFVTIFFDKEEYQKIELMYGVPKDSPLDLILFRSYVDAFPLMLSMNDRKIYVGIISDLGEPNEAKGIAQEIAICPIISGFRDKDTLKVNFTTHYKGIADDISLILKQSDIQSVTFFDFDTYQKFQDNENINI